MNYNTLNLYLKEFELVKVDYIPVLVQYFWNFIINQIFIKLIHSGELFWYTYFKVGKIFFEISVLFFNFFS